MKAKQDEAPLDFGVSAGSCPTTILLITRELCCCSTCLKSLWERWLGLLLIIFNTELDKKMANPNILVTMVLLGEVGRTCTFAQPLSSGCCRESTNTGGLNLGPAQCKGSQQSGFLCSAKI